MMHQAVEDLISHAREHRCADWTLSNREGTSWCTMCELLSRVDQVIATPQVCRQCDVLSDMLRNMVAQSCTMADGTLDSCATSVYADAMRLLESRGDLVIDADAMRRVIGHWPDTMPGAAESGGMSAQSGDRDTREPQSAGARTMGRPKGTLNADGVVITRSVGAVLGGMSPKAVAIEEGVPESTVRSWLRRAGVRRVYRKR